MVGKLSQYEKMQVTCVSGYQLDISYTMNKTPKFVSFSTDNEQLETNKIWCGCFNNRAGGGLVKDSTNARAWSVIFGSPDVENGKTYINTSNKTIRIIRFMSTNDFPVGKTFTVEIYG